MIPTALLDRDGPIGESVLIVDRDPRDLDRLISVLEGAGFHVLGTTDPTEAGDLALRERPEVILLGRDLFQTDGGALRRSLDALPDSQNPLLLFLDRGRSSFSALAPGDGMAPAARLGAERPDSLSLPMDPAALRARLRDRTRDGRARWRMRAILNPSEGRSADMRHARVAIAAIAEWAPDAARPRARLEEAVERLANLPCFAPGLDMALLLRDHRGRSRVLINHGLDRDCLARFSRGVASRGHGVPAEGKPEGEALSPFPLTTPDGTPLGTLVVRRPRRSGFAAGGVGPDPMSQLLHELAGALSLALHRQLEECKRVLRALRTRDARTETIENMANMVEQRDPDTGLHVARMAHYVEIISRALGLDDGHCDDLRHAATMHDIGKMAIPDSILLKPGKLTPEEYEAMKAHAALGAGLLTGRDRRSRLGREVAGTHHEKWDGSGYPKGLKGEAIPLSGRICAIADVFDALVMERPYKRAWSVDRALAHIKAEAGRHFDPKLVAVFEANLPEILEVKSLYEAGTVDPWRSLSSRSRRGEGNRFMPWSETYSVGIEVIDTHHKFLFDLVENLREALERGGDVETIWGAFTSLESYWTIHFQAEETLLESKGYTDLARHRMQHRIFQDRIRAHIDTFVDCPLLVGEDVADFLRAWLINHILTIDRGIKDRLDGADPEADAVIQPMNGAGVF